MLLDDEYEEGFIVIFWTVRISSNVSSLSLFPELFFASMSTYLNCSLDGVVSLSSTKVMNHTPLSINQCLSPQYMHINRQR
jgi:hypothetical protein